MKTNDDARYLKTILDPIRVCARYKPKFGQVRQGYKSKDSKRQNADIANAATAYVNAYLPCAVILSAQIDGDILSRYRGEKWACLTGLVGLNNPLVSTYDFMREVIGYDLAAFFERNSTTLRTEIDNVLRALLTPEATA